MVSKRNEKIIYLIVTKTHNENIKEKDCFMDVMISTSQLVREWVKQELFETVIDDQGEKIDLEETDINDWIMKPRMSSK